MDNRQLSYCIGLGSNVGDREEYLKTALHYLQEKGGKLKDVSSLYATEPWGNKNLSPFVNMVVVILSELKPMDMLDVCQEIEIRLKRVRIKDEIGYQDRTIDIDLLLVEDEVWQTKRLVIPHPHLVDRNFVLAPLFEIAPMWIHPENKKTIEYLHDNCKDESKVMRIKPPIIQLKTPN